MKWSLKARFWNWVYVKARNLHYYAEKRVNRQHELDNPVIKFNGTSSNCYPFEKIWEDDDATLYTFDDGEPI